MSDDPNANNSIRLAGSNDPVTVSGLAEPLPRDRIFRGAWRHDTGANVVRVDMELARPIAVDRVRAARGPKLDALDTQYMRADETGDTATKQSIAKRKQALRDATKDSRIAAAKTPDDLKAAVDAVVADMDA